MNSPGESSVGNSNADATYDFSHNDDVDVEDSSEEEQPTYDNIVQPQLPPIMRPQHIGMPSAFNMNTFDHTGLAEMSKYSLDSRNKFL